MERINFLEEENRRLKTDNKKKTYPKGGLIYIIDYSNKYEQIFKVGKTTDLTKRDQIYRTHTLHNHEVVHYQESDDPQHLESCILLLLHKYRYNPNNKKDHFQCDLEIIMDAFERCTNDFAAMNKKQRGGSSKILVNKLINDTIHERITIQNKMAKLDKDIIKIDRQIKSEQKLLKMQTNKKSSISGSKTAKPKHAIKK